MDYPPPESRQIEDAFQKRDKLVEFVEDSDDGASGLVRIDFSEMVEYRVDKPTETRRKIQRTAGRSCTIMNWLSF